MAPPTLPEVLYSQETLEFIGFSIEKAAQIWKRWQWVKENEGPEVKDTIFEVEFLDHALDRIHSYVVEDRDSAWEIHMRSWGIGHELIESIMGCGIFRCEAHRAG